MGVDDAAKGSPTAAVEFRVFADNLLRYQSPVMKAGQDPEPIEVAIPAGARQLRLEAISPTEDNPADYADWANAGFLSSHPLPAE